MPRTRLAPSPTGALHLGNARTFLINWALARQRGWQIVLRIDDLDGPRVKPEAAAEAIELLAWLGLDWDEGPFFQRADLQPYRLALQQLAAAGAIYPCACTRREIEAAALSAPHGDDHELRYPGTCRPAMAEGCTWPGPTGKHAGRDAGDVAWRLRTDDLETQFFDGFAGPHVANTWRTTGDFLVATKGGLPSYQLAVVVDDARQRIDHVVRGDDLLGSTHRQLQLYARLGLVPPEQYYHLPLVIGADGRRLAKRHGDTRVATYRARGAGPERVLGLLAGWCGMGTRRLVTAAEFAATWDLSQLPPEPIVIRAADDAWLRGA